MQKTGKNYGFTLIEIMVAVLILVVLSTIIINMITQSGAQSQADLTKVKIFAGTIKNKLIENMVLDVAFDDVAGTLAGDGSDYQNSGTLTGFSNTTAGYGDTNSSGWMSSSGCISGTCLKFNGSSNYVVLNSIPIIDGSGDYTISAWIYKNSPGATTSEIFCQDYDGWHEIRLEVNSTTGYASFNTYEGGYGTVTGNTNMANGSWHYLVGVKSGTNGQIYVDGLIQTTNTVKNVLQTDRATIGSLRYTTGNIYFFNGQIDEVRVYGAALTISQIRENYLAGLNKLLAKGGITQPEYNQRIAVSEKETAQK